jgi:hypothetical protein
MHSNGLYCQVASRNESERFQTDSIINLRQMSALIPHFEAGEQLSFLSCEATQQDAAHGEIEQHFTGFDETLIVLGQPPVGGEPTDGPLNGLITNDKFCLTRMGQLQLSWPRARHRLRRAVAPHLPDEVTHQGGQHAGSAATRLAGSAHQPVDAHGPAVLGPGVSAPSAVGDDLSGADQGPGVPNPAGGLSCE